MKWSRSAPVVVERGVVDYSHCDDKGKEPLGMCLCVHMFLRFAYTMLCVLYSVCIGLCLCTCVCIHFCVHKCLCVYT